METAEWTIILYMKNWLGIPQWPAYRTTYDVLPSPTNQKQDTWVYGLRLGQLILASNRVLPPCRVGSRSKKMALEYKTQSGRSRMEGICSIFHSQTFEGTRNPGAGFVAVHKSSSRSGWKKQPLDMDQAERADEGLTVISIFSFLLYRRWYAVFFSLYIDCTILFITISY